MVVGCRKGGGASVRIGIDESLTPSFPGRLTNDFVKVAFRRGAILNVNVLYNCINRVLGMRTRLRVCVRCFKPNECEIVC